MIRIGILGDIGSGKSYVANSFGHPVFNADFEVSKLYKKNKIIFKKLKKKLPNYIFSFPIDKLEITKAILANETNLKKIVKIVHQEIRKKMKLFIKKNKNKKFVILDIPLLLENKINNKTDILVFIESKKSDIEKRIKKRLNFNHKLFNKFKKIQYTTSYKKRKSDFIIKNDFTKKSVKKGIKDILLKIS
tara:strand:- start:911 stop:1480 length:570 start_codon:yes stop_codon:yes gene_type:complete